MPSPDNFQLAEGVNNQWASYVEEVVKDIDEAIQSVAREAVERVTKRVNEVKVDPSSNSGE